LHPEHRQDWDKNATQKWAEGAQWSGLEVRSTEGGQPDDATGRVEFVVSYKENGQAMRHHEVSRFAKSGDCWYYVDGELPKPATRRNENKVGRNEPCPCGSGKKYKKCCGR
jgi:SEC-C motif-containing protein